MNADPIAPSQPRRHKDTKKSQRHRTSHLLDTDCTDNTDFSDRAPSGDATPSGRDATTRSRGIEVWEGRSSNAHACRPTFPHRGSCLQHAHPASVDSRSATSFPHVTLSEPLRGTSRRVPRSTDSHRSNLFRIQLRWASTPRSRNEIAGAGFTPARSAIFSL